MNPFATLPIEIHVDTGNVLEAVDFAARDYVKGLTCNPTLLRKQSLASYEVACKDLLAAALGKPVSLEVIADDFPEMKRQALLLASWGNVLVKIPVTLTDGTSTAPLINHLSAEGVKVNVTAVTTAKQVVDVLNIANYPHVISIFAGRIADSGVSPNDLVRGAVGACRPARVKVLWASTRQPLDIYTAYRCGASIVTVPPAILQKAVEKAGVDMGAESLGIVKMFYNDAKAAGYVL